MDADDQMEEQENDNPQPNLQEQTMITRGICDWSELPQMILQNMYLCSTQRDRAAMSRVCRNWSSVFNDAVLWRARMLKYNISGNISQSAKLVELAERRANCFYNVEFSYAQCFGDITGMRALNLRKFFRLVIKYSPLKTVIFKDVTGTILYAGSQGFRTPQVFQHIKTLLLTKNVKTAGFHKLKLGISQAAWLLRALMAKKSSNLRHLTLVKFMDIRSERESLRDVLDLHILVAFINLETFDGTYSPLFEKIMNNIRDSSEEIRSYTENRDGNLRRFRLQCPANLQFFRFTGMYENAWTTLKTICPKVTVELSLPVNEYLPLQTFGSIKKDMPLTLLHFERIWGINNAPPEIVRIEVILNHLREIQIHKGLETLCIHWYDVYDGLEEELAQYLILCTNLETLKLHIRHPVRNFGSLLRMCLRNNTLEALKEYEIHIHHRVNQDMTEYRALEERYSPDLQARGVNLKLKTPND